MTHECCNTVQFVVTRNAVHGTSNMMKFFQNAIFLKHGIENIKVLDDRGQY